MSQPRSRPCYRGEPEGIIGYSPAADKQICTQYCTQSEEPVFWACGVTPQSVVMATRPDFCITHSPGCMFVTDLRDEELATG